MARRFLRLLDETVIPVYPNVGFFMLSPRTATAASLRAFTLAEVMMATVVTLVAVVGLVQAVTIGAEMLDVSRKQTVAMQLIRNEIEGVHLKDWNSVKELAPPPIGHTPCTGYFRISVNSAGTGLSDATPATSPNAYPCAAQNAFALTNFTQSYIAPYTGNLYDDNRNLMSLAKGFSMELTVASVNGRTDFLSLTYTVTWTGGNRHRVYNRTGTTYYGKYGLNLYYRR
jgi:hypothetical protein